MKKKQKKKIDIPQIKKNINDFLLSEEGKISEKDIAKLGISLAVLGMMLDPMSATAAHFSHASSHNSSLFDTGTGGHASNPIHTTHGAHGSHGAHGASPCNW